MIAKKLQKWTAFILILAAVAGWGALRSAADPLPPLYHFTLLSESTVADVNLASIEAPKEITIPFSSTADRIDPGVIKAIPVSNLPLTFPSSVSGDVVCKQLLLNPQLDVLELGDGTGRAEPWVVYDPVVYYSNQDYVSPQHSLVLVDADTQVTDPTPTQDAFAQALYMPTGLVTVTIEYYAAMANANTTDRALGNLWTVDANGEPVTFLGGWEVRESPNAWQKQTVLITGSDDLANMAGQRIAIFLFNATDGNTPGEIVLFDDVTLTACSRAAPSGAAVYLPAVMRNFRGGAGPICIPPSENPQDTWNANRGYVECNATCQSTLSRLDLADYYTFVPSFTGTGNCTLYLKNLPPGTEWAAMIFVDQPNYPPPYAPGPTNGQCRIATPGSGDKSVTCPLTGGTAYFIKVSAGANYSGPEGSYTMQITCPGIGPTPTPGAPTPTPQPAGIYGRVTLGGAAAGGVGLDLRFYNGSSWSTRMSTSTNSNGDYLFSNPPSLSSGQKYYVRYLNPSSTPNGRLWGWYGADITSYTSGTRVPGGDFDIKDVTLRAPSDGSSVTLPYTFRWDLRGISSDHYRLVLFDPTSKNLAISGDLGYVSQVTMTSLPPGWPSGRTYVWWVMVCQDAACSAYGEAFESWYVTIYSGSSTGQETGVSEWIPVPAEMLLKLQQRLP